MPGKASYGGLELPGTPVEFPLTLQGQRPEKAWRKSPAPAGARWTFHGWTWKSHKDSEGSRCNFLPIDKSCSLPVPFFQEESIGIPNLFSTRGV